MCELVKCVDCGCLSIRESETRELLEVDDSVRATGELPVRFVAGEGMKVLSDYRPICFRRAQDIGPNDSEGWPKPRFLKVINEPRKCEAFKKWSQGFTPREHYEMILSEQMLKMQREREDADREWRRAETERQRQWQTREAEAAENRHKSNLNAVLGQLSLQREGNESDSRFYKRYMRVMWIGVVAGVLTGAISGWLSGRNSQSNSASNQSQSQAK